MSPINSILLNGAYAHDDIADLLARLRAARRDASKRQGVKIPETEAVSEARR